MIETPQPVSVPIGKFKGWEGNPRNITEREMEALQASLKKSGFVTTVVARKGTYELIGGHQRVDAIHRMKEAGEEVPTHIWAILLDVTDEQAQQLNVSLNRTGGSFDEDLLADLFVGLDGVTDAEALAMGFEVEEIDALISAADVSLEDQAAQLDAEAEGLRAFGRSITLTLEFETVAQRDAAKDWVKQAAAASEIKTGEVVARLVAKEEAAMAAAAKAPKKRTRKSRSAVTPPAE